MRGLISYLALRVGVGLVGLLPSRATRWLGDVAGRVWYLFDKTRRRMASRHMRRVSGGVTTPGAAKRVMRWYGRYWAEALWIRSSRVPEVLEATATEGLEQIVVARDAGKGQIYALPHMGNWEVAAPVAVRERIAVVGVAERLANERITNWFTSMREEIGIEVVLATGGREVMRKLEEALNANKAVALLSDRDLSGRGVTVEFFGETTTLPAGPARLAVKTGAPLHPVGTYFDGKGHRVVVRPPIPIPDVEGRNHKVEMMTQALAKELEALIRREPEQWHLVVPNWPSDKE